MIVSPRTRFPFEVSRAQLAKSPEDYAKRLMGTMDSDFLTMPRGEGFVEYATWDAAYQEVRARTNAFRNLNVEPLLEAVLASPLALVVVRTMLALSPPEWAWIASDESGLDIDQGTARSLDREVRLHPEKALKETPILRAMIGAASEQLKRGRPPVADDVLHRFDRIDTLEGATSTHAAATYGVPYPMVLYERLLGRPFASHRDSVSETVGRIWEEQIEKRLHAREIPFQKPRRTEKIPGFRQAPDFIVPSYANPIVVIEAKLCEDDGTARDKIARIQALVEESRLRKKPYAVVACVDGRGFAQRVADIVKLLDFTAGKVFTRATLDHLVPHTPLAKLAVAQ